MEKWITAEELMALLGRDPQYRALVAEEDERLAANLAAFRENEEPLLSDLAAAGYSVGSVWDLVARKSSYEEAIPVLVKHLGRSGPPSNRRLLGDLYRIPETTRIIMLWRETQSWNRRKEEWWPPRCFGASRAEASK